MKKIIYLTLLFSLLPFTGCSKRADSIINSSSKNPVTSTYTPAEQANSDKSDSAISEDEIKNSALQGPEPKDKPADTITPNTDNNRVTAPSTSTDYNAQVFKYLTSPENRASVGTRAIKLNNGEAHNACVYFVSEALRRVGLKIPVSTANTTTLISDLKARGFKTFYKLEDLKPGDICFTTDGSGKIGGTPTHSYIFMGWKSSGIAYVCDNQIYDYNSFYHERSMKLSYLNNQKDKAKEATAFFMRK